MKYIGQDVYDFVARFRSDVIVEGSLTFDGVSLTAIQASGESFADNDTSLMTSASLLDKFSLLAGSSSITTLGTITTGVWNGTAITADYIAAAQTNITSLGTLTSLAVGSVTATGKSIKIAEDSSDFATIVVTTNGATTITTTDADGSLAHFEVAAAGDITLDAAADISLEAGGGDVNVTTDTFAISSTNLADPLLSLSCLHAGAGSARLDFIKDKGDAGADDDLLGIITFKGDNTAQEITSFASITAQVSEAADTDEAGKLTLSVAESNGSSSQLTAGLILEGEHATDGEVDVTIAAGSASTTTIAGTLTMGSTATINNSGVIQVATQGTIDHDSLANFVAAEHYDWSTNISGTATIETRNITNLAGAGVDGANNQLLTDGGDGTISSESELTYIPTTGLSLNVSTSNKGSIEIINSHNGATGGSLILANLRDGNGLEDADVLGNIYFTGEDVAGASEIYGSIIGSVVEADNADEAGQIAISVANDGTERNGITMTADKATAQEVDVTIANGAASLTTIAGTLTMGSTATINNSGVIQVAAQTVIDHDQLANFAANEHFTQANITTVGTIGTGVWNGTAIASANLDADTAHLTTDQTFTGIKQINLRKFPVSSGTDGNAIGDVVYFGGTTSMTIGKIYHYKSDGTWEIANADAVATADGLLGVALGAASDTNGVLLRGMVTLDHDPGAIGDVLYVQSDNAGTPGDATATAPSASGDCVRVIGYQVSHASNGNIWFNPDGTFVEVA